MISFSTFSTHSCHGVCVSSDTALLRSENFSELTDTTMSSEDGGGEVTAEMMEAKVAARKARREEKRKAAQDRAARCAGLHVWHFDAVAPPRSFDLLLLR